MGSKILRSCQETCSQTEHLDDDDDDDNNTNTIIIIITKGKADGNQNYVMRSSVAEFFNHTKFILI